MLIAAQILGFAGVGLYLLSYQLKKRKQIVWVTFVSNCFYVVQYVLLGAFSGAVMDIMSTVASFFAAKKHNPHIEKYGKLIVAATVLTITVVGVVIAVKQRSWLELIPIGGAIFQTVGLWCDKEQTIRKLGLCSAPCWLAYNFLAKAYGAALGSLLAIVSIITALARYRKSKAENTHPGANIR